MLRLPSLCSSPLPSLVLLSATRASRSPSKLRRPDYEVITRKNTASLRRAYLSYDLKAAGDGVGARSSSWRIG